MTRKRMGAVLLSALALILSLGYAVPSEAASLPGWAARAQFPDQAGCLTIATNSGVFNHCSPGAVGVDFFLPTNAGPKTITIRSDPDSLISCSAFVATPFGGLVSSNFVEFQGQGSVGGTVPTNGTLLLRCSLPGGATILSVNWNL